MLLTIAIILWVTAAAWFLITWALFRVNDLRVNHLRLVGIRDASNELQLDNA